MTWTLTTSGACVAKAGNNANWSYVASGANLARWEDEAEGTINFITRYNWVSNYANLDTNFKSVLSDVVSDMVGMKIINFDLSSYPSKEIAQTMLDVLRDNITTKMGYLKEKENQEKLSGE